MKKLSLGVLFIGIGLLFSGCGDSYETTIEKRVKEEFGKDARLLSFEEAKKEVAGLKDDKECLKGVTRSDKTLYYEYRFVKDSNGNIQVVYIFDKISEKDRTDTSLHVWKHRVSFEQFKTYELPQCFN